MKYLSSQFGYLFAAGETRTNLRALVRYLGFLLVMVTVYAILFHVIMGQVEGQQHSWITGFYWTLVVMTTLGFGDITFKSDLGRAFCIVVLLTGIVLLLIVLPFAFIRYFYAPWLEAQIRLRAPRAVPPDARQHVLLCQWDPASRGLAERLQLLGIPYFVIEPDPARAATMVTDGIPVITGELDAAATYVAARAAHAACSCVWTTRPTPT